jgi:hypothetical protein
MRFKYPAGLILCALAAFTQSSTSQLDGTVTDPTGAAIPGAEVTVVNVATGARFTTLTNERGYFALPSMTAASYKVTVAKQGFKAGVVPEVPMNAGVPATVNVRLELGQATETVEVVGGAELVQVSDAQVSTTLTDRQLTDLPFATRNAIELLVDVPGTQTPTNPRSSTVNGLPKGALNITIDGMNTQDNMLKSSDGYFSYIMPSVDALEEVTLSTSAAGVDTTGQGGAQIKFVTRSGTNQFHGGGFYQVRNTAWTPTTILITRSACRVTSCTCANTAATSAVPSSRTSSSFSAISSSTATPAPMATRATCSLLPPPAAFSPMPMPPGCRTT